MYDQRHFDSPRLTGLLAQDLVEILDCETLPELGTVCQNVLYRLTGSDAIGIYLTRKTGPHLLFSNAVPDGFLEEYSSLFGPTDPLIRNLGNHSPVTDATSSFGADKLKTAPQYELLRSWGFGECMCGLMRSGSARLGVIYTATRDTRHRYSSETKQQMYYLCQGASSALRAILREDAETHPLPPQLGRVAKLICDGRSNKEIARQCDLSEHTVKEYVQTLFARFGVDNRTALAVRLVRSRALN
ncbi:response regulator transcription factor [Rhodobacteraceae bacterium F11138]|nr:response regulator transcription factor [Rhodobacteraceae bacterium F11138]